MAPKAKIPQPIDRPLSRAYLREFTGWSTAYPPGLSDPTSLRIMENMLINKDGSCRIRPGLRYLSYSARPDSETPGEALTSVSVGSHEAFFLNDGTKAYLFAVRETDQTIGFRILRPNATGNTVFSLTAAGVGFTVPQGEATLNFTAATSYVKYLQIDNKIFALSNAGESMRLFDVGATKSARRITAIQKPEWSAEDKLTVVQPDAAWINSGVAASSRSNLIFNPTFELGKDDWVDRDSVSSTSSAYALTGTRSLMLESKPVFKNMCYYPLRRPGPGSISGWSAGAGAAYVDPYGGGGVNLRFPAGPAGRGAYLNAPNMECEPHTQYRIRLDYIAPSTQVNGALVRFFSSTGAQLAEFWCDGEPTGSGLVAITPFSPADTAYMGMYIHGNAMVASSGTGEKFSIWNVLVNRLSEAMPTFFSGATPGEHYHWSGTPDASASVYHPPADIRIVSNPYPIAVAEALTGSVHVRAGTTPAPVRAVLEWRRANNALRGTSPGTLVTDSTLTWSRVSATGTAPSDSANCRLVVEIEDVPWGVKHYIDAALLETGTVLKPAFNGSSESSSTVVYAWVGTPHRSPSHETTRTVGVAIPPAETPTPSTLISSDPAANTYNYAFFYTFSNEVGESAASRVTTLRAQRRWTAWRTDSPNSAGEPSGTAAPEPAQAADQLIAYMPEHVFGQALAEGATHWNLYMLTWSDQDPVPVTAVKVDTRELKLTSLYGTFGWGRATSQMGELSEAAPLPSLASRFNYSDPSKGGQGLVAADRMIMVFDPTAAAVIRWSGNQQGDYTNFTASKGGGYKTLTSGNMFVPACVKLWQNPQSADTLTILCMGTDGHSTGYYMQPASVTSQSDNTLIMGFEETTATPGTTSPYGCEVVNNALFHPLDSELMKSTASNYNINHKALTDQISNMWVGLTNKKNIVSSLHDMRVYYIVNNPQGAPLEAGCMGNEIWVYDSGSEAGSWSRLLIQAHSLRKIEHAGHVYMSVVRPDGIFYLDPEYDRDDYVDDGEVKTRFIPWRLETNVQGANRAHDAWAHLQQMELSLGNFRGSLNWGLRSWDLNGKAVDVSKVYRDLNPAPGDDLPFDIEDAIQVKRNIQEWFFYASSIEEDDVVLHSTGQVNSVQYRYAPVSVNVGYEYGSVETFEYGRATANWGDRTTDAGVPKPMTDVRRP